jgi:hypothetical protein
MDRLRASVHSPALAEVVSCSWVQKEQQATVPFLTCIPPTHLHRWVGPESLRLAVVEGMRSSLSSGANKAYLNEMGIATKEAPFFTCGCIAHSSCPSSPCGGAALWSEPTGKPLS